MSSCSSSSCRPDARSAAEWKGRARGPAAVASRAVPRPPALPPPAGGRHVRRRVRVRRRWGRPRRRPEVPWRPRRRAMGGGTAGPPRRPGGGRRRRRRHVGPDERRAAGDGAASTRPRSSPVPSGGRPAFRSGPCSTVGPGPPQAGRTARQRRVGPAFAVRSAATVAERAAGPRRRRRRDDRRDGHRRGPRPSSRRGDDRRRRLSGADAARPPRTVANAPVISLKVVGCAGRNLPRHGPSDSPLGCA